MMWPIALMLTLAWHGAKADEHPTTVAEAVVAIRSCPTLSSFYRLSADQNFYGFQRRFILVEASLEPLYRASNYVLYQAVSMVLHRSSHHWTRVDIDSSEQVAFIDRLLFDCPAEPRAWALPN